jgi:hypothetical protein
MNPFTPTVGDRTARPSHLTDQFFTTGPGRVLLDQPPCSTRRSVPVRME